MRCRRTEQRNRKPRSSETRCGRWHQIPNCRSTCARSGARGRRHIGSPCACQRIGTPTRRWAERISTAVRDARPPRPRRSPNVASRAWGIADVERACSRRPLHWVGIRGSKQCVEDQHRGCISTCTRRGPESGVRQDSAAQRFRLPRHRLALESAGSVPTRLGCIR